MPFWLDDVLQAADWMNEGLPPVAGGSQDQSHWFLDACKYLKHQHALIEADETNAKR